MADELQYVEGFSLTNRWLLYTSLMLSPAQFVSGLGSNCPSNIGFLAYNWYNQVIWYRAAREKTLHALSLLPAHFNLIYTMTYLGGVSSGNLIFAILLGLGTAGVMILNTVTAWIAWADLQREGYGVYQFFFFGWRVLDDRWHKFFLAWQIFDTLGAVGTVIAALYVAVASALYTMEGDGEVEWFWRYPMIPLGAVCVLITAWPLIMWTELIYSRNNIESPTDKVAVVLFIVQAVTMLVPTCGLTRCMKCRGKRCAGLWDRIVKFWFTVLCCRLICRPADKTQQSPANGVSDSVVAEQPKSEMEMTTINREDARDEPNEEGITAGEGPAAAAGAKSPKKAAGGGDENV